MHCRQNGTKRWCRSVLWLKTSSFLSVENVLTFPSVLFQSRSLITSWNYLGLNFCPSLNIQFLFLFCQFFRMYVIVLNSIQCNMVKKVGKNNLNWRNCSFLLLPFCNHLVYFPEEKVHKILVDNQNCVILSRVVFNGVISFQRHRRKGHPMRLLRFQETPQKQAPKVIFNSLH